MGTWGHRAAVARRRCPADTAIRTAPARTGRSRRANMRAGFRSGVRVVPDRTARTPLGLHKPDRNNLVGRIRVAHIRGAHIRWGHSRTVASARHRCRSSFAPRVRGPSCAPHGCRVPVRLLSALYPALTWRRAPNMQNQASWHSRFAGCTALRCRRPPLRSPTSSTTSDIRVLCSGSCMAGRQAPCVTSSCPSRALSLGCCTRPTDTGWPARSPRGWHSQPDLGGDNRP